MALTAVIKIVFRRGTLAQWTSANPILLKGEVGYVEDGGYFVIGDGVLSFTSLSPANPNLVSANRYRSEQYIVQNLLAPLQTALQNQITAEANTRASADITLSTAISNEATTRANADTSLQGQITAEVTARTSADASLTTQIATVNSTLSTQIATLESNIQTWYGNANNIGDILVFDGFTFQVLPVGFNGQTLQVSTAAPLGLSWQTVTAGDMTKAIYDPDIDGIVEAAEREQIAVINKTGATLTKGTIVYIKTTSSSGQYPEVLKANALTEATSSKTIGAIYEDIADSAVGYIITSGQVHNLNTSAYQVGTRLWLSTVDGGVTTTPPASPLHAVFIGFVTRSQVNNGRILYAIQNGYELGELHNVSVASPQINDLLYWDGVVWTASSIDNIIGYTPADQATVNGLVPYIGATQAVQLNTQQVLFNDGISLDSDINYQRLKFTETATGDYVQVEFSKVRAVQLLPSNLYMELNSTGLRFPDGTTQTTKAEPIITAGTSSQYFRGDKTWQTLNKSAVGLSNVDNTSDANKPISTATQSALNAKENLITAGTTAQYFRGDKTFQTLDKTAVGLSNVDNTSDANKPISTATQTALNAKENTITAGTTSQYWRGDKSWQTLNKSAVGLGNVDNTSDANKPISTATQTALNGKQGTLTLTTTGTSGAATLIGNTLNIPQYSGGGGGISSLNGLTGSTQTFAVGTSGTNFNIVSSGTSHTFNIPNASASNRGLVTTASQTFAGEKQFSDGVRLGLSVLIDDGVNIQLGSTVGTRIGTAASEYLSFYGVSPIDQPKAGQYGGFVSLSSNGGTALTDNDTWNGYTMYDIVGCLQALGLLQ